MDQKEASFLDEFKKNFRIIKVNDLRFNLEDIIAGLEICDPPDFVFETHYIEKFCVDAYLRYPNQNNKMASKQKGELAKLKERSSRAQDIFHTVSFKTLDERTSTDHLKENIEELIEEKTKKQSSYDAVCPLVKYRHLLILVESRCEVFVDDYGSYFEKVVPSEKLHLRKYEVYRDFNFIEKIRVKYAQYWDLLIFVEKKQMQLNPVYILHCIDLKRELLFSQMKIYPEKMFQIHVGRTCVIVGKPVSAVNIRYKFEGDERTHIEFENIDKIKIDQFVLGKHSFLDSVYISNDGGFLFESSQMVCAVDPKADVAIIAKYCGVLMKSYIVIAFSDHAYLARRVSMTEEFYIERDGIGYFKIEEGKAIGFKLNRTT